MRIHDKIQRVVLLLGLVLWLAAGSWRAVEAAPVTQATFSCANVSGIPQSECQALVALYKGTNGPGWNNNTGWLTTNTPCSWYGVLCQDSHVSTLQLINNNLSGALPPELGNLANLQELVLTYNPLSGAIPSELGNLANLSYLQLFDNNLSGAIPSELGNLANLQRMGLAYNNLSGPIPPELGNLANLQELFLTANPLSGAIPPELGRLVNLQHLNLWDNDLSGPIPPELGNLVNLQELNLSYNRLSGVLPPELGNLANLQELALWDNQLSGAIPPELGRLANLQKFGLGPNELSGPIPPELGNLVNLQDLNLSYNQLSGAIPPELSNLANLRALNLWGNQLSGAIPSELGNLVNLQDLNLSYNQLSGAIPPELGDLANLQVLGLTADRLSGAIPPELGNLANLQVLNLWGNQLSGPIPPELGRLVNLQELHLGYNQLSGAIPSELGNLANLQVLGLGYNQLSGAIPPELGNLVNLGRLELWGNQLSGLIPSQLANLSALTELLLGHNALTATDPALLAFLAEKQPDWADTQTVAPGSVQASVLAGDQIVVTWTPILYTGDGGYYEISYATDPTGPFTVPGVTPDKSSNQYTLTGLAPDTTYYVRLRTYTPAHTLNQNDLWSEYSEVVPATNLIVNPGFEAGKAPWQFYTNGQGYFNTAAPAYAGSAAARLQIDQAGTNIQLFQTGFVIEPQTRYRLSFAAYSSSGHDLSLYLHQHSNPYQNYGLSNFRFNLSQRWQRFTVEFTSQNLTSATTDTRLRFWLRSYATAGDRYWVDEVSLVKVPPGVVAAAQPGVGAVEGVVPGVAEATTVNLVDLETGGSMYQMTITPDAAGTFRFDQVPMGTYELSVEPPAGYLAPEPVQLLVSEEPNEEFVFVLEQATNSIYLPMISQ